MLLLKTLEMYASLSHRRKTEPLSPFFLIRHLPLNKSASHALSSSP